MDAYRTLKVLADHGARLELLRLDPHAADLFGAALVIRIAVVVDGVPYAAEELVGVRDCRTVGQLVENCVQRLPAGAFREK